MERINFQDLPANVLCLICSCLESQEPIKKLPLVSKKLLELTRTETKLWKVVKCCLIRYEQPHTWDSCRPKLQAFVSWLERRAAGVQRLVLQMDLVYSTFVAEEAWRLVERALASVAPNLQELTLGFPGTLEVGSWLASMPQLTRVTLRNARQLQLTLAVARCSSLRHLALSLRQGTELSFQGPQACLPPGLESLGLHGSGLGSLPVAELAQLQGLVSLSLSCSQGCVDDCAALSHLTSLRELSLDSGVLAALPHQISLLDELRVLQLPFSHGWADAGPAAVAEQFEVALSPLRHLAVLSLAGCGLKELPPAVAALTSLRALYLEHNSVQLCPGPYLAGLRQELCIDWNTLFTSHTVLRNEQPPQLSKLLLGGGEHTLGRDGASPANPPAAVAASLAACPSLAHLVDVLPEGLGGELHLKVAQLMYLLRRTCPRLSVTVLKDYVDEYSLDTLPPEWG